jgi:hypothetical protein
MVDGDTAPDHLVHLALDLPSLHNNHRLGSYQDSQSPAVKEGMPSRVKTGNREALVLWPLF